MKSMAGYIAVMVLVVSSAAFGQGGKLAADWQVFSPESKSFSVELPGKPVAHKLAPTKDDADPSFEDVHWLQFFNGDNRAKAVYIYVPPSEECPAIIFEAEVDSTKRSSKTLDDEVFGFRLMFSGDDHKVLKEKKFSINGHKARDVVYRHVVGGELYGRLLAVELPGRVIVMVYSRAKGNLKEEARIFNSFTIPSK